MKNSNWIVDRRRFLYGAGLGLALPHLESLAVGGGVTEDAQQEQPRRRFAAFYLPDGVPMPRVDDPAHEQWSWFPHGKGKEFRLTQCLNPLEPLRDQLTVLSGLSHPAARNVHGHSNADQFLTGANTGAGGVYQNSISLDQVLARDSGDLTRHSSLVLSTDGGTGSPRGAQTMSFDQNGRPIPAEHRPKRIFDALFTKQDAHAERQLALSQSALDELLEDARSLRRTLSGGDQRTLDQYMQSVRDAELRVQKAQRWLNIPYPTVEVDHLQLDITPEEPRTYLQTMFELIYLAFQTDSTRIATYQLGRENGVGVSDYLARAVGFNLTHQLSHQTKQPDGWKNFGTYMQFLSEELQRFATRLKDTPESGQPGSMLDNTLILFGSASSAFHLSRNYPLVMLGGKNLGFQHGQYLKFGEGNEDHQFASGISTDAGWRGEMTWEEEPLANLYYTILQRFGSTVDQFAGHSTLLDV